MAQITPFTMVRDINGVNGFGVPFSNYNVSAVLVASVEQTLVVPSFVTVPYPDLMAIFTCCGRQE